MSSWLGQLHNELNNLYFLAAAADGYDDDVDDDADDDDDPFKYSILPFPQEPRNKRFPKSCPKCYI